MAKKNVPYIDKVDMHRRIVEYYAQCDLAKELGKPRPRIPESLGRDVLLIATNLAKASNFYAKPYVQEMIGAAVEDCIKYFFNYDPTRFNNPFGYFTRICYYKFLDVIEREKTNDYAIHKARRMMAVDSITASSNDDDSEGESGKELASVDDFIASFERRIAAKRAVGKARRDAAREKDKLNGLEQLLDG